MYPEQVYTPLYPNRGWLWESAGYLRRPREAPDGVSVVPAKLGEVGSIWQTHIEVPDFCAHCLSVLECNCAVTHVARLPCVRASDTFQGPFTLDFGVRH